MRRDERVWDLDVESAVGMGMSDDAGARTRMLTDAAIAASHRLEELGIGPRPLWFLAGCLRSLGLAGTLALPEPLIGAEPTALIRRWMSAAHAGLPADVARDELFASWIERVAALIAARSQIISAGRRREV